MGRELTLKQKRFVEHYVQTGNATASAKAAGYSERTAYSQGHRLLKHVEVAKRIRELTLNNQSDIHGTK